MADRTAEYFEQLSGGEPFATLPADQGYQYYPFYPSEVENASAFVPSKNLAWNRIDNLSVEVEGLEIECTHDSYAYNRATKTFEDKWEGSSLSGGVSYSVVVTYSDYTTFAIEVTKTVEEGSEDPVKYIGMGLATTEAVQVELVEYGNDSSASTLSATVTADPILTATGDDPLRFYAVYDTAEQTHTVIYKWYDAECKIHQEVHIVPDGSGYPAQEGTLPSLGGNWQGKWVPAGPGADTQVKKDIVCEYQLYNDGITLSLDWNLGSSETATVTGTFTWCHPYPVITEKRTQEGLTLQGINLEKAGEAPVRVYNTGANPCANVTVSDFEGYSLRAKWIPSSAFVSDIADLRRLVGVLPSPFAEIASSRTEFAEEDTTPPSGMANFNTGFPEAFSKPLPEGKVITRQMVNTLGHLGSQAQFFEQCGGYYTFDKGFCDAIGGYPKGAILQFFDEASGSLRPVRSLIDNNEVNFLEVGVDGVNWEYAGDSPIVNIRVDYSSYEDLSERLFVETGVPDLYEVPYDSYLQAFAVGSVDCESLRRPPSEDVERPYVDKYAAAIYPVRVNGLYYANGDGSSFLDIYHGESQAFGSLLLGGFHPNTMLCWGVSGTDPFGDPIHHAVRTCPLSAFSCGVMLSKGDKIRVRNVITESNGIVEMPTGRNNFVHPMTHGDDTIRRKYNYRFAALYKRGVAL